MAYFGVDFARTPLGVASGPARSSAINAMIASMSAQYAADARGGKRAIRLTGDYTLDAAIVLKSGVILDMDGANLIPTFTGTADDPTNAVIKIDGTLNTSKLSTTLTAIAKKNSTSIAITAAGSLAPLDWIAIEGHNTEDAAGESIGSSVSFAEIIQVDASYVAGQLTVPLAWPLRQHHGTTGVTVKAVAPVIGAEVRGGRIWGSESSTIQAAGVFCRYATDARILGLQAGGLSRFGIDMIGCKDVAIREYRNRGGSNGWIYGSSVIGLSVRDVAGYQGVARVHASGVPRYPILLRARCTDVDADDIHLSTVACGMYIAGGEHIRVGSVDVTDVRPTTAIYNRIVAGGELDNGAPLALGFGAGYGPLALAEFAFDVTIGSIRVEDVACPNESTWTSPAPFLGRALYLHDLRNTHVGQISVINRGVSGDTHLASGVTISDFVGHIDSIAVAGFTYGLAFSNSANAVTIDRYDFKGGGGATPNSTIPIYCDHTTPSAQQIRIGHFQAENSGGSVFRTGGSFAGDWRMRFDLVNVDGNEWTDVILGHIGADVATGDVMEIDPSATDNSRQDVIQNAAAAGYERRMAAIVDGDDVAGSSFALICPLPARLATVKSTATAIARADLVKSSGTGTRTVQTDNAATHPLGRAFDRKAADAGGTLIRITSINP